MRNYDCHWQTFTRWLAGIRRSVVTGFHSLRHSAVSFLRQAGAAQSVSQAIVGHNSPDVHALYTHTDEDALRRAVATLPAVIGDTLPAAATPHLIGTAPIRATLESMTAKIGAPSVTNCLLHYFMT